MKRTPKLEIPPIALQRGRATPLAEQIHKILRQAIAAGYLQPGSRLPASRVLAGHLNVSRNSVLAAYDRLSAEGLISGRTGSGTRVCNDAGVLLKMLATRTDQLSRLRESGYPLNQSPMSDPDGNPIYVHR